MMGMRLVPAMARSIPFVSQLELEPHAGSPKPAAVLEDDGIIEDGRTTGKDVLAKRQSYSC